MMKLAICILSLAHLLPHTLAGGGRDDRRLLTDQVRAQQPQRAAAAEDLSLLSKKPDGFDEDDRNMLQYAMKHLRPDSPVRQAIIKSARAKNPDLRKLLGQEELVEPEPVRVDCVARTDVDPTETTNDMRCLFDSTFLIKNGTDSSGSSNRLLSSGSLNRQEAPRASPMYGRRMLLSTNGSDSNATESNGTASNETNASNTTNGSSSVDWWNISVFATSATKTVFKSLVDSYHQDVELQLFEDAVKAFEAKAPLFVVPDEADASEWTRAHEFFFRLKKYYPEAAAVISKSFEVATQLENSENQEPPCRQKGPADCVCNLHIYYIFAIIGSGCLFLALSACTFAVLAEYLPQGAKKKIQSLSFRQRDDDNEREMKTQLSQQRKSDDSSNHAQMI